MHQFVLEYSELQQKYGKEQLYSSPEIHLDWTDEGAGEDEDREEDVVHHQSLHDVQSVSLFEGLCEQFSPPLCEELARASVAEERGEVGGEGEKEEEEGEGLEESEGEEGEDEDMGVEEEGEGEVEVALEEESRGETVANAVGECLSVRVEMRERS